MSARWRWWCDVDREAITADDAAVVKDARCTSTSALARGQRGS